MQKEKFLEKVLTARVYDVARETPLDHMPKISKRYGNEVFLKREDLQPVFSFKNASSTTEAGTLTGSLSLRNTAGRLTVPYAWRARA